MNFKLLVLPVIISLISCGQSNPHRHFEKQRTSSDIKISSLNLETKQLKIRFEYRSYLRKNFKTLSCEVIFLDNQPISITLHPNITFDSFTTEILIFNNIKYNKLSKLGNPKEVNYKIECEVGYDKGKEYISKESTLYLVPDSTDKYR